MCTVKINIRLELSLGICLGIPQRDSPEIPLAITSRIPLENLPELPIEASPGNPQVSFIIPSEIPLNTHEFL